MIVNFICSQIVAHFCIAKTGHLRCCLYNFSVDCLLSLHCNVIGRVQQREGVRRNQEGNLPKCKSGKRQTMCKCALCTVGDSSCFHDIGLGPRRLSVRSMSVSIKSAVTGCDVTYCATTLQGFNRHQNGPSTTKRCVTEEHEKHSASS